MTWLATFMCIREASASWVVMVLSIVRMKREILETKCDVLGQMYIGMFIDVKIVKDF